MHIRFRRIEPDDAGLLWEFLYLAVHVPPGHSPYPHDILKIPEIRRYAEAWGRTGDLGYLACDGDEPVGAAWIRMLVGEAKGFGYVDESTPELAMSMLPAYRGQGIGSRLLELVLSEAGRVHAGVCLSVDEDNPAKKLYDRNGFVQVGVTGTSATMVKRFSE